VIAAHVDERVGFSIGPDQEVLFVAASVYGARAVAPIGGVRVGRGADALGSMAVAAEPAGRA